MNEKHLKFIITMCMVKNYTKIFILTIKKVFLEKSNMTEKNVFLFLNSTT